MRRVMNYRLGILLAIMAIALCVLARQEYLARPPEVRGLENAPLFTLEAPISAQGPFPPPEPAAYTTPDGKEHPYLFVAAEQPPKPCTVVLYMHGSGGDENEGMDTEVFRGLSGRIRAACRDRFWHYVSPRDYEFDGLLAEIKKRFAPERIFVIGHSLGGKETFFYQQAHPNAFGGVVYGCPALDPLDLFPRKLKTPTGKIVLIAGENEPQIAPFCRRFAGCLQQRGVPFVFVEYPNGNHCDPLRLANWDAVFQFLTGAAPDARENNSKH